MDGRKVYDLEHEKEYRNGQLIKEHHQEKTPKDYGVHSSQEVTNYVPSSFNNNYGSSYISQSSSVGQPLHLSSQYEKLEEEKFVNGQQVYDLYHEKEFKDGRLVKERHQEKHQTISELPIAISHL